VSLLSIVVAFLVRWGLDHTLIGWSPLHILIPSVWSLIAVMARNNLALRGGKSLSSWLWHRLNILLHEAENRFNSDTILPHLVLRSKLDAHRMYVDDQVVIHTAKMRCRKSMSL
jgi:hypothetical protein